MRASLALFLLSSCLVIWALAFPPGGHGCREAFWREADRVRELTRPREGSCGELSELEPSAAWATATSWEITSVGAAEWRAFASTLAIDLAGEFELRDLNERTLELTRLGAGDSYRLELTPVSTTPLRVRATLSAAPG